jgi:S-formylglutathione hydrolase FrmB
VTGPCAALTDPNNAPSTDPRIDHLSIDGTPVNVLVPPHYRQGWRRYPVVYLFHGAFSDEDSFETQTDLLQFTAGLDDEDQAIAVIPSGGYLPIGRDWINGTHPQAAFVMETLVPFVDSHYRTLPGGAFRAAAGFSAGGLDAMLYAARHPDAFVAAGSSVLVLAYGASASPLIFIDRPAMAEVHIDISCSNGPSASGRRSLVLFDE